MGSGAENQPEDDGKRAPPRERLDWISIAIFFVMLGAFIFALQTR
jgi:hypothetical protein